MRGLTLIFFKSYSKKKNRIIFFFLAHDHIVDLHKKTKEKDDLIQRLKDEIIELKQLSKRQKIGHRQPENNDNDYDDGEAMKLVEEVKESVDANDYKIASVTKTKSPKSHKSPKLENKKEKK